MVAVVLALGLSIGYVTDLAYGYTADSKGYLFTGTDLGTGQQTALKNDGYIVYGVEYTNAYSSLSCGSLNYPIINRIPLLGFYHQESYAGRPTATHLSTVDKSVYTMLGSQSIVGTSDTAVDTSILKGDVSVEYFQGTYVASFLTGFTGDIIKDSKASMSIQFLFRHTDQNDNPDIIPHITDESNTVEDFSNEYVEFTDIEGQTLRIITIGHQGL